MRTLGSQDLGQQVKLPEGASEDEWLAIHTLDFFNELNLFAGAIADMCTPETCPTMSAGAFSFLWADGQEYKQPTKMSAPKYMQILLTWVDRQLADESFLPVQPGAEFPKDYRKGIRVIYKRLFRIYAHTFHSHYKELDEQSASEHLNYSFKHFIYFVKEFHLIDDDELQPLKDLVALLMQEKEKDKDSKRQQRSA